ncbi:MAG: hypothetical protein EU531_10340 [Promethearchaeota archaeon]|nr:MAG: hypothetical protein EU531_10340 [Candidatus Lokiarchaeota archaeon]
MVDRHNQSFFGQSSGMTFISPSKADPFIFIKSIKKKENGDWEKPSLGEGKTIKCNLEEMVMILEVLKGNRKAWSSYHNFNESKTSISFKWDEKSEDKIYINIANYSKMLSYSQIIILRMLFEHLLKEKIVFATIPYKKYRANRKKDYDLDESSEGEKSEESDDMPIIVEEKVDLEDNKITQIYGTIKGESNKALLLNLNDDHEIWFPKSVIRSNYSPEKEVNQTFLVDTWILKKNNINYTKN